MLRALAPSVMMLAVLAGMAVGQISEVTPEELDAVPRGHQDIARNLGPVGGNASGMNANDPGQRRGGGPGGGAGNFFQPDPRVAAPSEAPAAPTDPRDFRGFWQGGRGGGRASYQGNDRPGPQVDSKYELALLCLVPPGGAPAGGQIFQSEQVITWHLSNDLRVRRIFLNRSHPKAVKPSYHGHSIGWWEGDSLVVDTVGLQGSFGYSSKAVRHGAGADIYDQPTAYQGQKLPPPTEYFKNTVVMASPTLHVRERFTKSEDGRQLTHHMSFDDAATGMQPYTVEVSYVYSRPGEYLEQICEDAGEFFGPQYAESSMPK